MDQGWAALLGAAVGGGAAVAAAYYAAKAHGEIEIRRMRWVELRASTKDFVRLVSQAFFSAQMVEAYNNAEDDDGPVDPDAERFMHQVLATMPEIAASMTFMPRPLEPQAEQLMLKMTAMIQILVERKPIPKSISDGFSSSLTAFRERAVTWLEHPLEPPS